MNNFVNSVDILNIVWNSLDEDTKIHSFNVANYALAFAQSLDIHGNELMNYYYYGLYHDIGKLGINNVILKNTDKLSDMEFYIIKQHVIYGSQLIENIIFQDNDFKLKLIDVVKHHHERVDGSGYIEGLKGEELSLECKIISVADSCDAILSDRCYKKGSGLEYLLSELENKSDKQWDSVVVEIAISYFKYKFKL